MTASLPAALTHLQAAVFISSARHQVSDPRPAAHAVCHVVHHLFEVWQAHAPLCSLVASQPGVAGAVVCLLTQFAKIFRHWEKQKFSFEWWFLWELGVLHGLQRSSDTERNRNFHLSDDFFESWVLILTFLLKNIKSSNPSPVMAEQ